MREVPLLDHQPPPADDRSEIIAGLSARQKSLSPRFFYDEKGSQLFDDICEQPEYYVKRAELEIMETHAADMAAQVGPRAMVIEPGAGSGEKAKILLAELDEPVAYVPVDISRDYLLSSAEQLQSELDDVEVLPVCANFTEPFALPEPDIPPETSPIYFPGSTIGNFSRRKAADLLKVMSGLAGDGSDLIIGVDLVKSRTVLEEAYNDKAGVTAQFNLNMLTHINRSHGTDFDTDAFEHLAVWDEEAARIEMRLISTRNQRVNLNGTQFELQQGEHIVTEHSHKYTLESFADLADEADLTVDKVWVDSEERFSVQLLQPR